MLRGGAAAASGVNLFWLSEWVVCLVGNGRLRSSADLYVTRQQLLVHCLSPEGMLQLSSRSNEEREWEVYRVMPLLLDCSLLIIYIYSELWSKGSANALPGIYVLFVALGSRVGGPIADGECSHTDNQNYHVATVAPPQAGELQFTSVMFTLDSRVEE